MDIIVYHYVQFESNHTEDINMDVCLFCFTDLPPQSAGENGTTLTHNTGTCFCLSSDMLLFDESY